MLTPIPPVLGGENLHSEQFLILNQTLLRCEVDSQTSHVFTLEEVVKCYALSSCEFSI